MASKPRRTFPGLWVRIHDRIWQDEDVLELATRGDRGLAAVSVFVMSVAWSHHAKRDGDLPKGCLALIHGKKHHADLLVEVGLWEATKTGWRIPKYDTWQDTVEQIEKSKAAKVAAGKKRACERWHTQPCTDPECRTDDVDNVIQISRDGEANA